MSTDIGAVSATTVTWLLASLAVSRVSLLLHELGHAFVALGQTSEPVMVQVGRRERAARISVGRLHISVAPRGSGGVCFARPDRPLSRAARLKRVLAGPAVNLLLGLLFGAVALRTHGLVRAACLSAGLTNVLMTVLNLIPHHARGSVNGGRANDGLQAWCLLRGKPVPPPAPRPARSTRQARPNGRPVGGRIGVALGMIVVGSLALTDRIPLDGALVILVVVAVFAWLGDLAAGAGRPRTTSATAPSSEPASPQMKRCPSCGAEVHHRAKFCYCYHHFE